MLTCKSLGLLRVPRGDSFKEHFSSFDTQLFLVGKRADKREHYRNQNECIGDAEEYDPNPKPEKDLEVIRVLAEEPYNAHRQKCCYAAVKHARADMSESHSHLISPLLTFGLSGGRRDPEVV